MRRAWTVGVIWLVGVSAPTGSDDAREVVLQARPATEQASASQILEQLSDGDVLRIRVEDGVSLAAGFVQQCLHLDGGGCFNSFPVQFDADGEARFQYQIHDRTDRCGPAGSVWSWSQMVRESDPPSPRRCSAAPLRPRRKSP